MSNTRHAAGVPVAFAKVPPSADVQEKTLAEVIGESVALHLGEMLARLLPQMPWQPDCFFCLLAAKRAVRAYQAAVANAGAAGEEMPELPPAPTVNRAVTQTVVTHAVQAPGGMVPASGSVWTCWDHLEVPAEPLRQTGLVDAAGRAIVSRR